MKKAPVKKETDTELLARQIAEGFGEVHARFDGIDDRFDGIDSRFDGIDERLDGVDVKIGGMHGQLVSLERGQSEINHRLDAIERKQTGILESLDETVHKSEFRKLVHRVEVLEK